MLRDSVARFARKPAEKNRSQAEVPRGEAVVIDGFLDEMNAAIGKYKVDAARMQAFETTNAPVVVVGCITQHRGS